MITRRRFQFGLSSLFLLTTVFAGLLALGRMTGFETVFGWVYLMGPLAVFNLSSSRRLRWRVAATCLTMVLLMLAAASLLPLLVLTKGMPVWPPVEMIVGGACVSIGIWGFTILAYTAMARLIDPAPRRFTEQDIVLIDVPPINDRDNLPVRDVRKPT